MQEIEDYFMVTIREGRGITGRFISALPNDKEAGADIGFGELEGAIRERIFDKDTVILNVETMSSQRRWMLLFDMEVWIDKYRDKLEMVGESELVGGGDGAEYLSGIVKCVRPISGISRRGPQTSESRRLDPFFPPSVDK